MTDKYINLFENALAEFKHPVQVKIQTRGSKGKCLKHLSLRTEGGDSKWTLLKVDRVLSEGEKRAVALADFLTEVALDESSCGVVLDDPVTSLDHEWKQTLATKLALEAKRRQVIVFTHDLPFVYYLTASVKECPVETSYHWIQRSERDDRPGYVSLNDGPALEQLYKNPDYAIGYLKQAKIAVGAEQERHLRSGFGALRSCYEAFVVYELFNGVVQRFDERIKFGQLTNVVWHEPTVVAVNEKFGELSRYIEGYLHTDAGPSKRPSVVCLQEEIEFFQRMKNEYRSAKKATGLRS